MTTIVSSVTSGARDAVTTMVSNVCAAASGTCADSALGDVIRHDLRAPMRVLRVLGNILKTLSPFGGDVEITGGNTRDDMTLSRKKRGDLGIDLSSGIGGEST